MTHVTYLWDEIEDNVIEEYDGNGGTIVSYTTDPTLYGSTWVQNGNGQVRNYQFDGQGNTASLTDEIGNVADTRNYSAFGEVTASSGTTQFSYQWGGSRGLAADVRQSYWIRRRSYQPKYQRWRSVDPLIGLAIEWTYSISNNNPVNAEDPSGLMTVRPGKSTSGKSQCDDTLFAEWEFEMDKKCNGPGWIIQKVTVVCEYGRCADFRDKQKKQLDFVTVCGIRFPRCLCLKTVSEEFSYFEAWFVEPNQFRTKERALGHATDTAKVKAESGRCERLIQSGEIRFYCEADMQGQDVPKDWQQTMDDMNLHYYPNKTSPCRTTPYHLRNRNGKDTPWYWKDPSVISKDSGKREFVADWTCCDCKLGQLDDVVSRPSPKA